MGKPDPNIIREGDLVRIVKPEVLVRVGYPLDFATAREQVAEEYYADILTLLNKVHKTSAPDELFHGIKETRAFRKIVDALAYEYLRKSGFGGSERRIYTRTEPKLQGEVFPVAGIKFHKTGTYYPPSGGYSSTWCPDYDDYEPGGLADEKTHKFVDVCTFGLRRMDRSDGTWIEVCNVEKIPAEDVD